MPAEVLIAAAETLDERIEDARALNAGRVELARAALRSGLMWAKAGNARSATRATDLAAKLAEEAGDTEAQRTAAKAKGEIHGRGTRVSVRGIPPEALAHVLSGELLGRDELLAELFSRAAALAPRFVIVWGESGSGKSAIVRLGLMRKLQESDQYVPVLVDDWQDPEQSLRSALDQAGTGCGADQDLLECVRQMSKTQTVVFVCDQFERFFAIKEPLRRNRFKKTVKDLLGDYYTKCRFVFVVRSDELGRMAEFDGYLDEPLAYSKRLLVPFLSSPAAKRLLHQIASRSASEWDADVLQAVVADLEREGGLRPKDVTTVGAAMLLAGVRDRGDYARAGRAEGLLADYLPLILKAASSTEATVPTMKRILLALVDEPPRRLSLPAAEIARRVQSDRDSSGKSAERSCAIRDRRGG